MWNRVKKSRILTKNKESCRTFWETLCISSTGFWPGLQGWTKTRTETETQQKKTFFDLATESRQKSNKFSIRIDISKPINNNLSRYEGNTVIHLQNYQFNDSIIFGYNISNMMQKKKSFLDFQDRNLNVNGIESFLNETITSKPKIISFSQTYFWFY